MESHILKSSERSQSNAQNASIRKIQIPSMQEQSLNPKLQEELNRFKEIQMNPQLLLQTLSKMEQERRQVEQSKKMKNLRFGDTKENEEFDVSVHRKNKSFLCHICGSLLEIQSMEDHIASCNSIIYRPGKEPNKASKCNRRNKIKPLSNSKTNRDKGPHICEWCSKSYLHRFSLREHVRVHTGEMPFTCIECNKRFRQRCALTNHRKICGRRRKYAAATFPLRL